MGKRKNNSYAVDDEFFAQVDFLRDNYDRALETIEQQKTDIKRLLALMLEKDIPIPGNLIDRYIRRAVDSLETDEELPFY